MGRRRLDLVSRPFGGVVVSGVDGQNGSGATTRFTLSSLPPLGALMGIERTTLVVGLAEDESGALRVYLGKRWKNLYILVTEPDEQDTFRRAWGSGGHIWMSPVPGAELIHCDESRPW